MGDLTLQWDGDTNDAIYVNNDANQLVINPSNNLGGIIQMDAQELQKMQQQLAQQYAMPGNNFHISGIDSYEPPTVDFENRNISHLTDTEQKTYQALLDANKQIVKRLEEMSNGEHLKQTPKRERIKLFKK